MASFKRSYQRNAKRAVSAMLVTAMCLSGGAAVFADETSSTSTGASQTGTSQTGTSQTGSSQTETPQTVSSAQLFSDVANGFWAEKHIYKLAAEGIILGDAGKFRPGDVVTQQEAITMAIRLMNLDSQLGDGSGAPADLKVGNYFKPYLELALSKNLLDKNEEVAATADKESWGEKKATREWVAKILVRALGKDAEAKASATLSTGFADQSSISANARGYVNVAVQLKITTGVEGNKFEPQGKVTRAQMATFLSRGGQYVSASYEDVYEGIVTNLTDNGLTLYANGQTKTLALDNRTVYFTKDSETRVAKSQLKLYTKVMAIDKTGSAAYVEITDPAEQLDSLEGTLLRVLSDNRLLLLVDDDSETITYDDSTVFLDQSGKAIKPADLALDSKVIVKRETFSGQRKPVIIQSTVLSKSGTGVVDAVDADGNTVTIKDKDGSTYKFEVDKNALLQYQNQLMSLSELQKDATVEYKVTNSVLVSLKVTESTERTIEGTLLEIGADGSMLTIKRSSGALETKLLDEEPKVKIGGIAAPGIDDLIADLKDGDQVKLTLNGDDVVTEIEVLGRNSEQLEQATVVSYDPKLQALMVMDKDGNVDAFTLGDETTFDYDSGTKEKTLAGMEALLTKNRVVNITHLGKRALSIQIVYKYEGTLVNIDTSEEEIELKLAGGEKVTLPYDSSIDVEIYGKSNPTLRDFSKGDSVVAVLNSKQNEVELLGAKISEQFKVDSVNSSNHRISANKGKVSNYIYAEKAQLIDEEGKAIKLSALNAGDTINVDFEGLTAVKVQRVEITLGVVTSVDGSALTIKTYTDGSESFNAKDGSVTVERDGKTAETLSGLSAGDRVVVSKTTDGGLSVKVLTSISRPFSRYDSVNKEIVVKRASIADDAYMYAVTSDTYIHQGDTTISVQSLQENDKIVLYFNGDELVEIEKQ
ncbi:S-layer homology domain-containing protein [Paenibacillus oralis]|uniref:S-layer homology domain-containing protein n=1 Tax=Paenibacillus oralis TaxID=2490856 RepID=A0A3P3U958_9BACL|nr:S-layer homology domain-containing protein [Paenibacillus oralis]RRJ66246.1 S-layer homology domain-containing protein [Paenibacillus oralis]